MSKISNWPLQWRAELGTWEGVLLKPPITDYWPTGHLPLTNRPTDLRQNRKPDSKHVSHSIIVENFNTHLFPWQL